MFAIPPCDQNHTAGRSCWLRTNVLGTDELRGVRQAMLDEEKTAREGVRRDVATALARPTSMFTQARCSASGERRGAESAHGRLAA